MIEGMNKKQKIVKKNTTCEENYKTLKHEEEMMNSRSKIKKES